MKTKPNGKGVYQIITDQIITLLEKGTIPWKQPWRNKELPQNLLNRIPYRGINMMLLSSFNFERNLFLTFKQIKRLSLSIKEGEEPLPVVFWKWPEPVVNEEEIFDDDGVGKKVIPILRYYSVYNISQLKDLPDELLPPLEIRTNNHIEECERIIKNFADPPAIQFIDQSAYYSPSKDLVNVPEIKCFDSSESYYSTLFHELVHSTGHPKRLDRKEGMKSISFGSDEYSKEELIAEIGACYLEAHAGITAKTLENNASYINGWLAKLRNDNRFIIFASSKAQKAADYIVNSPVKEIVPPQVLVPSKETKPNKINRRNKSHKNNGDET